jgi:hypothetical protein
METVLRAADRAGGLLGDRALDTRDPASIMADNAR